MHRREAFQWAKDRVKIGTFADMGYDIDGLIHVGANDGYEIQFYLAMGIRDIIAFEPLPSAFKLLREYEKCGVTCIPYALGNHSGKEKFYVTAGDGQGSSLLETTEANTDYPDPTEIEVDVVRFEDFMDHISFHTRFKIWQECLVVDVQGYEHEVLLGFGRYLERFKYLNIECSRVPVYKGEAVADVIIDLLFQKGFERVSPIEDHNDILFIRKDCF